MTLYKKYDQQELNNQYNTRLHVPDYGRYFEKWEKQSDEAQKKYNSVKNIFYGSHEFECMDIFPAQYPGSKTLIFIHGGFWHLLDKELFHFLSVPFLENGMGCAFINYREAPAANMDEIVLSCRQAIMWIRDHVVNYNGDPSELYLLGHSAGGHLSTMFLTIPDFSFLKGVVALSGLYRLHPVMHSYLNDILQLDKDIANRNSPVLLNPVNSYPLLLMMGSEESDEFKDQSTELYNSWQHRLEKIELIEMQGQNHYSILDSVVDKDSPVQASIFQLINN